MVKLIRAKRMRKIRCAVEDVVLIRELIQAGTPGFAPLIISFRRSRYGQKVFNEALARAMTGHVDWYRLRDADNPLIPRDAEN